MHCKCANGTAATGKKCTEDGSNHCVKCNTGYNLKKKECIECTYSTLNDFMKDQKDYLNWNKTKLTKKNEDDLLGKTICKYKGPNTRFKNKKMNLQTVKTFKDNFCKGQKIVFDYYKCI